MCDIPNFCFSGISSYVDVIKVIDGDTISISLDLELKINGNLVKNGIYRFNVRLLGINTEELHSKSINDKHLAIKAKDKLKDLITSCNNKVFIKLYKYDKYGRILGELFSNENDIVSFNDLLLNAGLAKRYTC